MLANPRFSEATIAGHPKAKQQLRGRKRRRHLALESLEDRVVLSYTFSLVGQTATVSPVAATGGPILIDEVLITGNPFLEWSQDNGVTFSADWDDATPGTQTLPATTASTINLTPTTGAGSSITLGDPVSPASNIFALFHLGVVGTPANNSVTIDDSTSTQAAGTYDFYSTLGTITGPGGATGGINFTSFGPVNSYTLEGGPAGNTFNIHSTFNATTTSNTIVGGAGDDTANVLGDTSPGIGTPLTINLGDGTNIVNVLATDTTGSLDIVGGGVDTVNIGSTGGPGTMANIQGPISVTNPPSLTDLNFHDENDTTGQTWTLDNNDGVPSGSVAVTGSATTSYNPFDLASLTVNAGSGGNTFIVNATSAFYPTTLNTGTGDDTTNVFATGDNTLDIHGQQGQDTVTLGADPTVGMQNLFGTINVDNALGFTDLTLDDSADTTGQTALLFNDGTNGQVTGLSPATINYVNDDTSSLTVFGGSGGNTFTVDGTITNINLTP